MHYVPDKARLFQARIHMPWFMQRSWDLSVLRASTGWTFQLNTRNIRPWDAKIFHAVQLGEVEKIIELLKNKEASIYDVTPYGNSLLHIATFRQDIESIKALLLMGMKISDLEPSSLFDFIYRCLLKDPQANSPIELGRQWITEIGGISFEHPGIWSFICAFWETPSVCTLLLETGLVRQILPSIDWVNVNPGVPLKLIESGLAETSDFPPDLCCLYSSDSSSLIYQYFHSLLNSEEHFHDWRCLARKVFLGVPLQDIVHPHDGGFCSLSGIVEALWARQFRLLPFVRWIQRAVGLWLEDLAAAGINLEEYMSLELRYSRDCQNNTVYKDTKMEIRPGTRLPESGPSLVVLSVGPRADDWSFSWDPCVEELSGDFWTALQDAQVRVPGAWVDERTEDSVCLLGDRIKCWFRRYEREYCEGLQVRGILTCQEFRYMNHGTGIDLWSSKKIRDCC